MADPQGTKSPDIQGEGNYEATRRYDKAATAFAQSTDKVKDAARKARPVDPADAEAMQKAEQEGKSHSKGEDAANVMAQPVKGKA
ncbi:hypothetical protein WKW80_06855 [Variovorax humicola]|uniref:Uncharacterized protein n=1 Tax=Variovorax humicola TaxID=1769758 RepID=A0ABU8VVA4_9BURK